MTSCEDDKSDCFKVSYVVRNDGTAFVQKDYCETVCKGNVRYDECVYQDIPCNLEACTIEERRESIQQYYYDADCGANRTCKNGACRNTFPTKPKPGDNGNTGNDSNYCRNYAVCANNIEFLASEYCKPMRHLYHNRYDEACTYENTPYYSESCRIEARCGYSQAQCVYDSDCPHNRQCVNDPCQHYDLWSGSNGSINDAEIQRNNDAVCQQYGDNVRVYYNGNRDADVCAKFCIRDSNCPSGYVCEFTGNDIDSGVCLNRKYPCKNDVACGKGMTCVEKAVKSHVKAPYGRFLSFAFR